MIILGAGGHATEIAGILYQMNMNEELFFFDNVTKDVGKRLLNKFEIINSEERVIAEIKKDPRFIIGVGNPYLRHSLSKKFTKLGGMLSSVIAPSAKIGIFSSLINNGLNIMTGAVITEQVEIGNGSLINCNAIVHHGCTIGEFCEISPGVVLLGKVIVGSFSQIGAGAIILPKVKIGKNAIIGAGAVVTKDIGDNKTAMGIPAK